MYNCLRCAFDSFKSFADDMLSGLSQNLNSYILWDSDSARSRYAEFIFCLQKQPGNLLQFTLNRILRSKFNEF